MVYDGLRDPRQVINANPVDTQNTLTLMPEPPDSGGFSLDQPSMSTLGGTFPFSEVLLVTISGLPASGWYFVGWSGDCDGGGPCQVTMDRNRSVIAHFSQEIPYVKTFVKPVKSTSSTEAPFVKATVKYRKLGIDSFLVHEVRLDGEGIAGGATEFGIYDRSDYQPPIPPAPWTAKWLKLDFSQDASEVRTFSPNIIVHADDVMTLSFGGFAKGRVYFGVGWLDPVDELLADLLANTWPAIAAFESDSPTVFEVTPRLPDLEIVRTASPGELRLVDSLNRTTGTNAGQTTMEIPNSMLIDGAVLVLGPQNPHSMIVRGAAVGTYGLEVASVKDGELRRTSKTDVPIVSGEIHQIQISLGQSIAIHEIDADGDGGFESTAELAVPQEPQNLWPVSESKAIGLNPLLSWQAGSADHGNLLSYDVYLGEDPSSMSMDTVGPRIAQGAGETFQVSSLKPGTDYYSRVRVAGEGGIETGPLWSFTTVPCGDINGDGSLNAIDAISLLQIAVGRIEATEDKLVLGDTNSDGKINVLDAIVLLKVITGVPIDFCSSDEQSPVPPPPCTVGHIAFHRANEIYIMCADGTGEKRLTGNLNSERDSHRDTRPALSPDGTKIVFESDRHSTCPQEACLEIYTMNADGSNPVRLTCNSAPDWNPAWSPNGSMIVFDSTRDGTKDIYRISSTVPCSSEDKLSANGLHKE